ncbi:MAG: 3'-5' exonuclease, partial [Flavobacteriales bacterium]
LEVALLTDADIEEEGDNNRVSLMTVHAAKGLEFPFVFVTGLEENLFPSQMSLHSREDLEEERRLFYVAITRAEKHAYISYALNRYKWGNLITSEPSRFIDEIDQQYLDIPSSHYENEEPESSASVQYTHPANKGSGFSKKRMKKVKNQDNGDTKTATESELQVGTEVKHQKFGKGKVLKLEGNLGNKKATVFFPNVGQKKLLLKFAKLDVLN